MAQGMNIGQGNRRRCRPGVQLHRFRVEVGEIGGCHWNDPSHSACDSGTANSPTGRRGPRIRARLHRAEPVTPAPRNIRGRPADERILALRSYARPLACFGRTTCRVCHEGTGILSSTIPGAQAPSTVGTQSTTTLCSRDVPVTLGQFWADREQQFPSSASARPSIP